MHLATSTGAPWSRLSYRIVRDDHSPAIGEKMGLEMVGPGWQNWSRRARARRGRERDRRGGFAPVGPGRNEPNQPNESIVHHAIMPCGCRCLPRRAAPFRSPLLPSAHPAPCGCAAGKPGRAGRAIGLGGDPRTGSARQHVTLPHTPAARDAISGRVLRPGPSLSPYFVWPCDDLSRS